MADLKNPILSNTTFLIVEDEAMSRSTLNKLLLQLDVKSIETAKNGAEALERLAAMKTPPDVMLVDIHMPVMSGPELLHELSELGYLGMIALVSCMEQETLDVAEQLACMRGLNIAGVLSKPVTAQALSGFMTAKLSED